MVWSLQSAFTSGYDVWDAKFPICFIPLQNLREETIKQKIQENIANIVGWSLRSASKGFWPSEGPAGFELEGSHRKSLAGRQLAGGYRACYFGFRADGKARKESHLFQRSYLHSLVCEACMAQKAHKQWQPLLTYKNFYPSAAFRMTTVSPAPRWFQITCSLFSRHVDLIKLGIGWPS